MDRAALIGIIARALACDHDIHAMIAENPLKLDNVGEPRDLFEDQGLIGEQARDHQRKRCILRSRNRDCAAQTLTTDYAYSIHACPRISPWRFTCIVSEQAATSRPARPVANTFRRQLRRKSDRILLDAQGTYSVLGFKGFGDVFDSSDVARPRSCALRRRRFSRSSMARRWLRSTGFLGLLSFGERVMAILSVCHRMVANPIHCLRHRGSCGSFRRVCATLFSARPAAVAQW